MMEARVAGVPIPFPFRLSRSSSSCKSLPQCSIAERRLLSVCRGRGLVCFSTHSTDRQIADLVTKGKTSLIKGFRSRDGKPFDAYLTFDKDFRTVYGFPPRTDKPKGKERRR